MTTGATGGGRERAATPIQQAISAALQAIARRCDGATALDGQGFNAFDAEFGRQLAELRPEWLTEGRLKAAHRLLKKYSGQLAQEGIDYQALPVPGAEPGAKPVDQRFVRAQPARVSGNRAPSGLTFPARAQPEPPVQPAQPARPAGLRDSKPMASGEPARAAGPAAPVRRVQPVQSGGTNLSSRSKRPEPVAPEARAAVHAVLGPLGVIAQKLPGYEARAEQLRLAELVAAAISKGDSVVGEASTGVGKSLAYLVPGVLSGKRVIVSTADKALQGQIWGKDIPFLQAVMPEEAFTAALLKGRSNYACLHHHAEAAEKLKKGLDGFGFEQQASTALWPAVDAWVREQGRVSGNGDIEQSGIPINPEIREMITADSESCIGLRCPFHAVCFAERAIKAAREARVVVVNHALLLRDLDLRFSTGGAILPSPDVIVLDECHEIEAVATDAFGADVTSMRWRRLDRAITGLVGKSLEADSQVGNWKQRCDAVSTRLDVVFVTLTERLREAKSSQMRLGDEEELFQPAMAALGDVFEAMRQDQPEGLEDADIEAWGKRRDAVEKLLGDIEALGITTNPKVVRYAEIVGGGKFPRLELHVKPIEVADELRERLWKLQKGMGQDGERERVSVIATSATIAVAGDDPMDYWRKRVGCDDAHDLVVGSPFDYAQHALLYIPENVEAFTPRYGESEAARTAALADEIERLIDASGGGAFCLFTSVREMNAVHTILSPRLGKYLVLKQGDGDGRPEMVRRFKADGNAVLFGVRSFWQGVDVQGDALRCVILDKLPFNPPSDPVWSAKCDAVKRRGGSDFRELALPATILQLKQGFGRLIRTKVDRGVVAILDSRIATARYGQDIVEALPPAKVARSIGVVRAFYDAWERES